MKRKKPLKKGEVGWFPVWGLWGRNPFYIVIGRNTTMIGRFTGPFQG